MTNGRDKQAKLGVAVVGADSIGKQYLQIIRDLGLRLVGIADPNAKALALAAAEWDVPAQMQFTDVARMCEVARPQCVVIATTAASHCENTCLAAEAGVRFVLCEPPMAASLAECDQMLDFCKRYKTRLAVNHQMRFMDQYTLPKALAQTPEFGSLTSVTVIAGNIGLASNGAHYFEMFRFLTDEAPTEVTAWFSPGVLSSPRGKQFEERAGAVRASTPSGKRFYMEIGADQGHGSCVIYTGRYGRLVVDELAGTVHLTVREAAHRAAPTTSCAMPWVETTDSLQPADRVAATSAVLNALLQGIDYPDGEVGRQATAALVAAHISDESGHVAVPLDGTLPHDRVFFWS